MNINLIQIFLTVFLIFALSRVILRFKGGNLSLAGLLFWSVSFGLAAFFVIFPIYTSEIARSLGIGRGVDVIIYASIIILFYLVFRLYVYMQDIRKEITDLVKKIALKDIQKK